MTYSLEGNLIATPHQLESADFDMKDYSLYGAAVGEWGGFVFVNLTPEEAEPLEKALGDTPLKFKNYHPERLKVGFRYVHEIKANLETLVRELQRVLPLPASAPGADRDRADLLQGSRKRETGPGSGSRPAGRR